MKATIEGPRPNTLKPGYMQTAVTQKPNIEDSHKVLSCPARNGHGCVTSLSRPRICTDRTELLSVTSLRCTAASACRCKHCKTTPAQTIPSLVISWARRARLLSLH